MGVAITGAPGVPPPWCAALVRAVDDHPALELRALVRATGGSDPGSDAGPAAGPIERVVEALLRAVDRPLHAGEDAPAAPLAAPPGDDAPDALSGCDAVLWLDPSDASVAGPDPRTLPALAALAPGTRLWRLESRGVRADVEAALLAGLDVGDVVLREHRVRRASGTTDPGSELGFELGPERVHATHALPAQSFSGSDRLAAALGALPAFATSALARVALGIDEPRPDVARLAARDRLRRPGPTDRDDPGDHGPARDGALARRRLAAACRLALRQLGARALARFTEERWELAWHPATPRPTSGTPGARAGGAGATTPTIDALLARPVAAWRPLLLAPDRLRADPFALAGPDGIDLWFEDLPDGRAHAHLAHARLVPGRGPDGEPALAPAWPADVAGPALESAHHLSYPFAFEHRGARYMIPETGRAGRIELWREDGSPRRWAFERVLIDGIDATDTTLLRRSGRWWLFTSAMSHRAVDERDLLLLYRADALDGPWTAHPANPIVRGVEGARMAGPLVELDGALVRPSQYGGRRYGHGLNLNRVDVLDAERYAETLLGRVVPDGTDGWLGLHTLCLAGDVAFADRLRRRPRPGIPGLVGRLLERPGALR